MQVNCIQDIKMFKKITAHAIIKVLISKIESELNGWCEQQITYSWK